MKWSTFYAVTGCVSCVSATLVSLCMPHRLATPLYISQLIALVGSMLMTSHRGIDSVEAW